MRQPLTVLTEYRRDHGMSLDDMVDALRKLRGFSTSKATLSRVEAGEFPVSLEMLPHLIAVTGLSGRELRPDIAPHFVSGVP